uniref:BPTI/Kunitz inhibitor domain-containing protein n=1 Tax=Angiostrongylus cantonensis TaxID=6313 RepID=A0A0K0DCZ0_ANGCA
DTLRESENEPRRRVTCRHVTSLTISLTDISTKTLTCLPFKYTGCGGNANNFKDSFTCTRNCIPMDYHNCAANSPPVKRERCPKGSTCIKGFVIGLCCDDEEYGNENIPRHYTRDSIRLRVSQMTLFGKTCEHQFCPEGAECHQGAFFAYCCQ